MATVDAGRVASETFSLTIYQTGKGKIDTSLRSDLFPGTQSDKWVCGVSSLQVPLDGTRFLDERHPNLLMLRRRTPGPPPFATYTHLYPEFNAHTQILIPAFGGQYVAWTEDTVGTLRHNRFPVREIGDLLEAINAWTIRINQLMNQIGLTQGIFTQDWDAAGTQLGGGVTPEKKDFRHLYCRITPSGTFQLLGSALFWSTFFIEASLYAVEVLGLPQYFGVYINAASQIGTLNSSLEEIAPNNQIQTHTGVYQIQNDDWMKTFSIAGTRSLWGSLDTRIAISLDTDMPLGRNVVISEEKETRSYSLGTFSLNNEVKITNNVGDQIMSEFSLTSQSRAGSVMLKSANLPIVNWVTLRPDSMVRNVRMRLKITERIWNAAGGWSIVTRELPVESHNSWNAKLIFAKRTA